MRILGLDIGASFAVAAIAVLEDSNRNLKDIKKIPVEKLTLSRESIEWIVSQDVQGVVLEPTGGHYSRLWIERLRGAGLEVRLVGHREVANYRQSLRLANKSDKLDAIALALFGVTRWSSLLWFVSPENQELRDLLYQHKFLTRIANAYKNRIRQQLAHELPEIARDKDSRQWGMCSGRLWRDLAGETTMNGNRGKAKESTIGSGISEFTKCLAAMLCMTQDNLMNMENRLNSLIDAPEYTRYKSSFDALAVPPITRASLLTVIHPFDRFLENGKPIIEYAPSRTGTRSRRNRSLAAFKLCCGMGTVLYQSGGSESHKSGGSALVRRSLWVWMKMSVIINPPDDKPEIEKLRHYYQSGSDSEGKHYDPGKGDKRVIRTARRAVERLFWLLIEAREQSE